MQMFRARPWSLLKFLFGIVIGIHLILMLKIVANNTLVLEPICNKTLTDIIYHGFHKMHRKRGNIFIGIMTTDDFIITRGMAIYQTWSESIDGRVVFFVSENTNYTGTLPIIRLRGISDNSYPPQKKVFKMLKYIYNNFVEDFEWFIRADDDVYIKGRMLATLLRSIDSRNLVYMGQPGKGIPEEHGKLGLIGEGHYCIGGPGVIFSHKVLSGLVRGLDKCQRNVVTFHEDTELGRCVQQNLGISCTVAREASMLFLQNYKDKNGSYTHQLGEREESAISLHPVKDPRYMYRLHQHFETAAVKDLRDKIYQLKVGIHKTETLINEIRDNELGEDTKMVISPAQDLVGVPWEFVDNRYLYALTNYNRMPKQRINHYMYALNDVQLLSDATSDVNGYIDPLDFKNGYKRRISTRGTEYRYNFFKWGGTKLESMFISYVRRNDDLEMFEDLEISGKEPEKISEYLEKITFIVPVFGRHDRFKSFLKQFVNLSRVGNIRLLVALFHDAEKQFLTTYGLIHDVTSAHRSIFIDVVDINGEFTRSIAFMKAIGSVKDKDLLLLIDMDMVINENFLGRIRLNTIEGKQIYFPIYFSQYDPKVICFNKSSCTISVTNLSRNYGLWRHFGYGMVGIYKSDLVRSGGFNTNITGWGKEDLLFYEACLKQNYSVFRAPDVDLIHLYHEKHCNETLEAEQLEMCLGSKSEIFGAQTDLAEIVYNNEAILDR